MHIKEKTICILLFLLFLPLIQANLQINEIMYAPLDANEWIEIYNPTNQSINLTNWLLTDNKNTDTLECCSFDNGCTLNLDPLSYAIITDQDTTLYNHLENFALKICVDDNSLGNGLGNSGDTIKIHNNNSKIFLNYSSNLANRNNFSLEFDNGVWRESFIFGGTPGKENSQKFLEINVTSISTFNTSLINTTPINNLTLNFSNNLTFEDHFSLDNKKTVLSYEIKKFSSKISSKEKVNVKVLIKNENTPHKFSVWSYIYRGRKCYSCIFSRKENLQIVSLAQNEEKIISFTLDLLDEINTGEYNLKVKIIKDDQLTAKELKEKINIIINKPNQENIDAEDFNSITTNFMEESIGENIDYNLTFLNSSKTGQLEISVTNKEKIFLELEKEQSPSNKLTGKVVYQSKSRKIKGLIPYFIIVTFMLVLIVFVLNR